MACFSRSVFGAHTAVLLIILLGFSNTSAQDVDYRLPTYIKPVTYNVKLEPNYPAILADVTDFKGSVEIIANVEEETSEIAIHVGNHVEITSLTVKKTDGTAETNIESNYADGYSEVTQIQKIQTEPKLQRNDVIKINIEFTGLLEEDMHGLYKSTYYATNEDGKEELKFMLATQFESTYARKAFPCFDEPKLKAKFTVSMKVPPGYGALSNTPMSDTSTETLIEFPETVKMSTYLLAFIVYEKDSYGPSIGVLGTDDVRFTTWGRITAMKEHLGDYSQTITHRILSELEDFTDIDYNADKVTMTKIDQAAIPDFSSGAMENWGLVTYRETGLLFDEVNGAESSRKSIAMVIAHELTHQWFGNLVTMEWWSATWLNEGFARYFQYFILDGIYPQWRIMEQFVVDQQMSVFANDALSTGVVLDKDVITQADINDQFSTANYQKGGVVVRLLSFALGDHFQMGLQDYLETRSYDTATTDQLFDILGNHFHTDVDGAPEFSTLKTWAKSPGYPVVTFKRDSSNSKVTITQERFLLEQSSSSKVTYPVYLEWTTSDGNNKKFWLVQEETTSTDALPENDDGWFIVNNTGYFRVNYDTQNWRNIYLQLAEKELERIAPVDRATLVDNALNLARVGKLEYESALAVVSYLQRETDYIPWVAAFNDLDFLHRMLINVDESGVFNKFVNMLIQRVYNFLSFQDRGDHLEKLQRASTLSWACKVGNEECHKGAVSLLSSYIKDGTQVSANLRSVSYCYGIKTGPENFWLKMWQKLEENEDASERSLLISALGCSQSYSTLYIYLQQSLLGKVIRQQDASTVFSAVYSKPEGVDVALDFLVENFDEIKNTYVSMNALTNTVTGVANYLTKPEQRAKMAKLVAANPDTLATIGATALATIDTNLKWLETYKDDVLNSIEKILSKEAAGEALW